MFSSVATRVANNRVQILIQNKFKLDYLCKDWCNLRMQYLYALPKPLVGRLHKALSAQSLQWLHYICKTRSVSIWNLNVLTSRWILVLKQHSICNQIHMRSQNLLPIFLSKLSMWHKGYKNAYTKVCIIKNCTNSSADNSASRHDSLNLNSRRKRIIDPVFITLV